MLNFEQVNTEQYTLPQAQKLEELEAVDGTYITEELKRDHMLRQMKQHPDELHEQWLMGFVDNVLLVDTNHSRQEQLDEQLQLQVQQERWDEEKTQQRRHSLEAQKNNLWVQFEARQHCCWIEPSI